MLTDLYTQRALIWAFANRDFATRYRSSILGWAWSLIQPLATLIVFAAVFSIVFRIEAPPLGNGNGSSYAAFLFTGLVTWNLFSSLLNLSMTQLKSNGELLKKVQFPAWTPILGASHRAAGPGAARAASSSSRCSCSCATSGWTWILAIPILVGHLLFAQGIGLMLSILNARFGDVHVHRRRRARRPVLPHPGALPDQHDRGAERASSAGSSSSTR